MRRAAWAEDVPRAMKHLNLTNFNVFKFLSKPSSASSVREPAGD